VVVDELEAAARPSPCEGLNGVALLEHALVRRLDEGAAGIGVYEDVGAARTVRCSQLRMNAC